MNAGAHYRRPISPRQSLGGKSRQERGPPQRRGPKVQGYHAASQRGQRLMVPCAKEKPRRSGWEAGLSVRFNVSTNCWAGATDTSAAPNAAHDRQFLALHKEKGRPEGRPR
jgi:hypothetical protein